MPRSNRLTRDLGRNGGYDCRGVVWDASGVTHAGMVARGAHIRHLYASPKPDGVQVLAVQGCFCIAGNGDNRLNSIAQWAHFFSSVSQFVTSTSGAVLSVIESTTRNLPSRATSYASVGMEWRMRVVNKGLAAPICTAWPCV